MSSFLSLLPADGWPRLLSDALWQSTLIGTAGLLITRFLVRQSAAKSWVLLLALSACLLVPLASMSARSAGLGILKGADLQQLLRDDDARIRNLEAVTVHQEDRGPVVVGNDSANEAVIAAPQTIATPAPSVGQWMFFSVDPDHLLLLAFGMLWSAASILLVGRFVLGCFATWRLLRRAEVCTDAALLSAAAAAASRVGLAGTTHLLVSPEITTPMILALGRPRLLVPATMGGTKTDWTAAFTHELAHAVRGDGWLRLWSEIVLIVLPMQPLVWLLRQRFHIACEEACDDWAVATGADPVDLAEAMAAWIHRSRRTALLAAIGMSSTKARMLRLLNLREKPVPQAPRLWRWSAGLVAMLSMAGLAMAQTPRQPAAESRMPAPAASSGHTQQQEGPSDHEVEKRLNDDSLVVVFVRRIASDREYLKETPDDKTLLDDIKSIEERIEKRKAEIRPRIVEQLRLEQSESKPSRSGGGSVDSVARNPYIIEPPDIITLDPMQLVPNKPVLIAPLDKVKIVVEGTKVDMPISGNFQVDSSGYVVLGPGYGAVKITGLTRSEAEEAVKVKLQDTLNAPQVALIIDESRLESGIKGDHLVGPDGTITLGTYGSVYVAGLTIAQARQAIEKSLSDSFSNPKVAIEVKAFNSKVYYVILEGSRLGDSILRLPITGTETVLDAIAQVRNLSGLSQAKISIARPSPKGVDEVIQIDWGKALEGGRLANPQILPGDRVFVRGAKLESGMKEPAAGSYYRPTPAKPSY